MKKFFTFFLLSFVFLSCRVNDVYIRVVNPAPVSLPPEAKHVGILNRSLPSGENKNLDKLHETLSAETPAMLQEGSAECIRGLKDAFMANTRFTQVSILDSLNMKSPAAGMFSAPLSWETVEKICADNKLDALFVLELYDTDLKVTPVITRPNPQNLMQVVTAMAQVNMSTTVKTGWRIYIPQARIIPDEYTIGHTLNFSASGATIFAATEALVGRKEAIKQTSNKVGHIYADRILPYWIRVTREYFIKGDYSFKVAKRMARTGNWDGAAAIWEKAVNHPSNKIAGRACYNMAIINEINGDLDNAIKWAQKSYEEHGTRLALYYVNELKERRYQNNRLKSQEGK